MVVQVREKEDRHQQQKMDGFLRSRAALEAAASPSAADVDMEVSCPPLVHCPAKYQAALVLHDGKFFVI